MMNIEHHFIEKGQGTPLVLLHGNGENNEYFEHQVEYFSKDYRVIAIDTRGHGKTLRGEASFTLEQFSEDLKWFLDNMKITKAIILGFSDGGNVALLFALKYQEYVEALIIDGANLSPKGMKAYVQIPIYLGYLCCKVVARIDERFEAKEKMLRLMTHQPNIKPAELANITVPVLVMAGSHDVIKNSHTEEIYNALPNAKLVILAGDHFIAAKKPQEFNKSVEKFLRMPDNL